MQKKFFSNQVVCQWYQTEVSEMHYMKIIMNYLLKIVKCHTCYIWNCPKIPYFFEYSCCVGDFNTVGELLYWSKCIKILVRFWQNLVLFFWIKRCLQKGKIWNTSAAGQLRLKSSCLHMSLCGNNSASNCARELLNLKPSKDPASLLVYNEKKLFWFWVSFFCEWRHKWSSFRPFWPFI